MRCKEGVTLDFLRPEMTQLFPTIDQVFWAFNKVPVITATRNGQHMKGSLHGQDLAFDLRIKHLGEYPAQKSCYECLRKEIDRLYQGWYDVLFEGQHTENAHIHIEPSPLLLGMIEGSQKEVPA